MAAEQPHHIRRLDNSIRLEATKAVRVLVTPPAADVGQILTSSSPMTCLPHELPPAWQAVKRGLWLMHVALMMMALCAALGLVQVLITAFDPAQSLDRALFGPAIYFWAAAQIVFVAGCASCLRIPNESGIRRRTVVLLVGSLGAIFTGPFGGPIFAIVANYAFFLFVLGIAELARAPNLERRAFQLIQLYTAILLTGAIIAGIVVALREQWPAVESPTEFAVVGLIAFAIFYLLESQAAMTAWWAIDLRIPRYRPPHPPRRSIHPSPPLRPPTPHSTDSGDSRRRFPPRW